MYLKFNFVPEYIIVSRSFNTWLYSTFFADAISSIFNFLSTDWIKNNFNEEFIPEDFIIVSKGLSTSFSSTYLLITSINLSPNFLALTSPTPTIVDNSSWEMGYFNVISSIEDSWKTAKGGILRSLDIDFLKSIKILWRCSSITNDFFSDLFTDIVSFEKSLSIESKNDFWFLIKSSPFSVNFKTPYSSTFLSNKPSTIIFLSIDFQKIKSLCFPFPKKGFDDELCAFKVEVSKPNINDDISFNLYFWFVLFIESNTNFTSFLTSMVSFGSLELSSILFPNPFISSYFSPK